MSIGALSELTEQAERIFGAARGTPPSELRTAKQAEVAADRSPYKALLCGRRGGKTFHWIYEFADKMAAHPGESFVFVEKTRRAAKNKLWRPFRKRNRDHRWGLEFREADMEIVHPNGSILYLAGADKSDELDKVRGLEKVRLAVIDECGTQKPINLEYMAIEVLEPSLMDTGGDLGLSGTPGAVMLGYWYEVTNSKRPGWSIFRWDARDNPHIRAETFFQRVLQQKGWDESNPIFRREFLGEWIRDESGKVFAYDPERNFFRMSEAPARDNRWTYILAMDFGVVHSIAWVILAYGSYGRDTWILKSRKKAGLAPSEAAEETLKWIDDWAPDLIVGDLGGLGKAYGVEFEKRYGIPIQAADKRDKRAALEFTSDALRTGTLHVSDDCPTLHEELESLLWDERHEDIAEGQDDHESEAAVYGFRRCPAYANLEKEPSRETDGLPEWVDRHDDPDDDDEELDDDTGYFGVDEW